ncbi:Hydroxyquinol 1,2-dioxygenase [compost metagenome]
MRNLDEANITQAVLARNSGATDARLCEVMTSLVQHLHAFARDIKLTEKEWQRGMEFLAQAGNISSPDRQEFVLLSHTLGLSTLVLAQNDRKPAGCTEATTFDVPQANSATIHDLGAEINAGRVGPKFHVLGVIRDVKGNPIPGATLQVSSTGGSGHGGSQALIQASQAGDYHFWTVLPDCQPIVDDSPVGHMLTLLNRHAWRPAHLQFDISAPGYQRLNTQVFREGDPYLDSDAVFGVRPSLIAEWVLQEPGHAPDGTLINEAFYTLSFDFVLTEIRGAHE